MKLTKSARTNEFQGLGRRRKAMVNPFILPLFGPLLRTPSLARSSSLTRLVSTMGSKEEINLCANGGNGNTLNKCMTR